MWERQPAAHLTGSGASGILGAGPGRAALHLLADGHEVALSLFPGDTIVHRQVYYRGKVGVNLIGTWRRGFSEPLWIMTNLKPEEGQHIDSARMKIDETLAPIEGQDTLPPTAYKL